MEIQQIKMKIVRLVFDQISKKWIV